MSFQCFQVFTFSIFSCSFPKDGLGKVFRNDTRYTFDVGEACLSSRIAAKKLTQCLSSRAMEIITFFIQIVIVSYQCYTIILINL